MTTMFRQFIQFAGKGKILSLFSWKNITKTSRTEKQTAELWENG